MADEYYALRYQQDVPLHDRKHAEVVGRFSSFGDAEEEREKKEHGDLMEVVHRDNDIEVAKAVPL